MPTLALVVNEPPPYRIPIFNRIAAQPGLRFRVIFCCRREPNRAWDLPAMAFDHVFLRESITTVHGATFTIIPMCGWRCPVSNRMW